MKSLMELFVFASDLSLLSWERGLKFALHLWLLRRLLSLLSWERGLKLRMDEFRHTTEEVAPLVGAWIEILLTLVVSTSAMSLPSWECGLKYQHMNLYTIIICCVIVELVVKSIFIAITLLINNTIDKYCCKPVNSRYNIE